MFAVLRDTIRIYTMRFEWDESKNEANQQKHGVTFEFAALVFDDPNCLITLERIDDVTGQRMLQASWL